MITVIAKCIGCGNKREIKAGEIPQGEQPCCDKCGMPMIAESAKKVGG
jgi:NAD-dependent SIR2 family protein deacetylase